jgi:hypothetical protein
VLLLLINSWFIYWFILGHFKILRLRKEEIEFFKGMNSANDCKTTVLF